MNSFLMSTLSTKQLLTACSSGIHWGLTVLNSLLNHTSLFTSYVAIDPSVWWDNQALMKKPLSYCQIKTSAIKAFIMHPPIP